MASIHVRILEVFPPHEPEHPLTPSLSPSDGERVASRTGEGRFMGRENCLGLSGGPIALGFLTRLEPLWRKPAVANKTNEIPGEAALFTLSPGERAGVRASVKAGFLPSRLTPHASRT